MRHLLIPLALIVAASAAGCGGILGRNDMEVRSYDVPKTPMSVTAPGGMPPSSGLASAGTSTSVQWKTPSGWVERAASNMRAASFGVDTGGDASIVILGGTAGGVTANVNRWRGQISLPPESDEAIAASAKTAKGAAGDFQWFKLLGTAKNGESILAAILSLPDMTVFVKLTGPSTLLDKNQNKFLALCKSIHPRDAQ